MGGGRAVVGQVGDHCRPLPTAPTLLFSPLPQITPPSPAGSDEALATSLWDVTEAQVDAALAGKWAPRGAGGGGSAAA